MSKRCSYYHCQAPQACACYGWCVGHRAGLATWLCDHFKDTPVSATPHIEPVCATPHIEPVCATPHIVPVIEPPIEQHIEQPIEPVSAQEEEPTEDELIQIKQYLDRELSAIAPTERMGTLRINDTWALNTVNEDATPPTTPHELIEQLALEHQATMEKVSREMQEMKAKLEYYESQAIIKEQIASKEREIKSLESTTQLEKKAAPTGSQRRAPESLQETTGNPNAQALGRHRTLSVPRVTQRVGLGPIGLKPAEKISKK